MTLALPKRSEISEEAIQTMSVAECVELRRALQEELQRFYSTNPGVLARFINKLNERLFEANYYGGAELYEANEG